ncbi:Cyclin-d4-1 [Thalictrum thalictroides]|uniref:Cyclin-d4-1 n=1 Tax=Thalictrum thalictroides TaxID=46969 RepID=A0A7J6WF22_THATH|nr:Cyclin-d4-1 [Thalictrum thalictroides]
MSPSLLCSENRNICFQDASVHDDDDDGFGRLNQNQNFFNGNGDFFVGLSLPSEECMSLMVKKEHDHLPRKDYLNRLRNGDLDIMVRKDAIDWMNKVHSYYSFGPLSAYLSINYLDRFLSNYELPTGKAWAVQLLAVACLSLAAKMEENEVPQSLDLQLAGEPKFVFEASTIQRMELLVLSTLEWRMQTVTPFSFIDYFLYKINDNQTPSILYISQSVELILTVTNGIEFLGFKPSEVAAAVAISVLGEKQMVNFDIAASCFIQLVQKERVFKCSNLIKGSSLISKPVSVGSASHPSTAQSPIGVLDASCLSYKTDELTAVSGLDLSCASPDTKRRKLNKIYEVD